jgi:hypothetical protein
MSRLQVYGALVVITALAFVAQLGAEGSTEDALSVLLIYLLLPALAIGLVYLVLVGGRR